MRQKKRVWSNFELFDGDAMAEYLEIMAKKGWMLISIGNFLTFKRIQPSELKFTVDVMNNSSVFDSLNNKNLIGFREMCEDAGWDFVCTNGIIQIFVSNNPNIIPIQTDNELKGKMISKNVISKTVPIYLLLLVMCSFQLFFFGDVIGSLWSNLSLITMVSFLYACTISTCQLITALLWYFKYKMALYKGNVITYPKFSTVKIRSKILVFTFILYASFLLIFIFNAVKGYNFLLWFYLISAVCCGLMFLLLKWILKLLREKYNFSRKINRLVYILSGVIIGITMSVSMATMTISIVGSIQTNGVQEQPSDLVPLITIEFLEYDSGNIILHKKEESVLAAKESYKEIGMVGEVSYYIDYEYYTSRFTNTLNSARDNHLKEWRDMGYIPYEKVNITGLEIDESYLQPCTYSFDTSEIHSYEYLLKNKKSLLLLKVPEKLTVQQLIEIVEKMK